MHPKTRLRTAPGWSPLRKQIGPEAAGACVNFLEDEGTSRIREACPGSTLDRLVGIKTAYDHDNLFRFNQNTAGEGLAHSCEARDVSPAKGVPARHRDPDAGR